MSEPVYSRAPDVVWRLGPDRVLVRRIGDQGDDAAAELVGPLALVWIALDQSATVGEIAARLEEVDLRVEDLLSDLAELQASFFVKCEDRV